MIGTSSFVMSIRKTLVIDGQCLPPQFAVKLIGVVPMGCTTPPAGALRHGGGIDAPCRARLKIPRPILMP